MEGSILNLRKRYILFTREGGKVTITSDGTKIADILKVSKHTIYSWFRKGNTVVDRYEKQGFILVKGGKFLKSERGMDNFKRKKYNW